MVLYSYGNALYRLEGDYLVKAKGVVPGQMSLFDQGNSHWDEDKHPRADDGKFSSGGGSADATDHRSRVDAAMEQHKGKLSQMLQEHKQRIQNMGLRELHDHAPDVEYDEYHTNSMGALDEQIKAGVDPGEHDQIDQHFDDLYDEKDMLGYADHVSELEEIHGDRIAELEEELEEIHGEHVEIFDTFAEDALDESNNGTYEQWQATKERLGQKYKQTLKAGVNALNAISAPTDDIDQLIEALHESYQGALDQYSDDPEDWEDWDPDDDD